MSEELKPCPKCGNTRASGWISVDERLPDINDTVLVKTKFQGCEVKTLTEVGCGELKWYPGGGDLANSTHWMPLPK